MPKKIDTSIKKFAKIAEDLGLDLFDARILLNIVKINDISNDEIKQEEIKKFKVVVGNDCSEQLKSVVNVLLKGDKTNDKNIKAMAELLSKWHANTKTKTNKLFKRQNKIKNK